MFVAEEESSRRNSRLNTSEIFVPFVVCLESCFTSESRKFGDGAWNLIPVAPQALVVEQGCGVSEEEICQQIKAD